MPSTGGKTCAQLHGDGDRCIPGCSSRASSCDPLDAGSESYGCSFRPEHLREALFSQGSSEAALARNNEMVVDMRSVESQLPRSIEAFFYVSSMGPSEREQVRRVRERFLAEHKLDGRAPGSPPLLRLDFRSAGKDAGGMVVGSRPFHVA